ncbi:MAG: DUF86 domain-containing protein [Candidatus Sericytochromatia bacterium]|nr:DUF86 domain-containing protein [Candidatus Tanganyikabacteria bacterium]
MQRPDHLGLGDIREAIGAIERFLTGVDLYRFLESEIIRHAVLLNLIVIGEAATSLSDAFKGHNSHISWREPIRLRNRLVHGYFAVDWEMVWDTATRDVPALARDLASVSS